MTLIEFSEKTGVSYPTLYSLVSRMDFYRPHEINHQYDAEKLRTVVVDALRKRIREHERRLNKMQDCLERVMEVKADG